MLAQGIDTVVLGCTHYPFVIPLIEEISGPGVRVIDPAPAVARQVERLLKERRLRSMQLALWQTAGFHDRRACVHWLACCRNCSVKPARSSKLRWVGERLVVAG